MRPNSIVMFERLFLASLVVGVLNFVLGYDKAMAVIANDPNFQRVGAGSGLVIGLTAASYAVYLLLWHLIARKAANVAKWILVVFSIFGVIFALPALRGPWDLALLLAIAAHGLEVAAVLLLFRRDAVDWLNGRGAADPAVSD
jgi:hypothetical protein